jgi:hypothetical protein
MQAWTVLFYLRIICVWNEQKFIRFQYFKWRYPAVKWVKVYLIPIFLKWRHCENEQKFIWFNISQMALPVAMVLVCLSSSKVYFLILKIKSIEMWSWLFFLAQRRYRNLYQILLPERKEINHSLSMWSLEAARPCSGMVAALSKNHWSRKPKM